MDELRVGDLVEILPPTQKDRRVFGWNEHMDASVGKQYKIRYISFVEAKGCNSYKIQVGMGCWSYPIGVLKKVGSTPVSKEVERLRKIVDII